MDQIETNVDWSNMTNEAIEAQVTELEETVSQCMDQIRAAAPGDRAVEAALENVELITQVMIAQARSGIASRRVRNEEV